MAYILKNERAGVWPSATMQHRPHQVALLLCWTGLAVASLIEASPPPPPCSDRVLGLGLACNSSCTCANGTGCVPIPAFAEGAAKCMPTYPDVKVVHVINSCHLDIGFVDSSVGIINLYFDKHIPQAIELTPDGALETKLIIILWPGLIRSLMVIDRNA